MYPAPSYTRTSLCVSMFYVSMWFGCFFKPASPRLCGEKSQNKLTFYFPTLFTQHHLPIKIFIIFRQKPKNLYYANPNDG